MSASSSCVLNAIKALAGIDDSLMLISPIVLEPILKLKINILGSRSSVLKVDDVLAALAITAATNTMTARAMEQLPRLRDCEMHASCMSALWRRGHAAQAGRAAHLRGRIPLERFVFLSHALCKAPAPQRRVGVRKHRFWADNF